jgi:DsbC/DsbD-like thiol-disulfide interchange protein
MATMAVGNFIQRRKKLVWLGALGIAALLTVGMVLRTGSGEARYLTAEVQHGNITATVQATGTINPLATVPVGSYVSGTVKYIIADFNTRVFRYNDRALIGWLGFFLPPGFVSAPASIPHAKVALVSEQTSVQPGHTVRLGLHFELEKDWHIYWVNPGDSGEPPRVEWKLPPRFHAGPLEWPAPRRLENGPLVDYGYQNEVLLMTAVRAPVRLKPGGSVELQANVSWLVCHDICIPCRQTVALSLPVSNHAPKVDARRGGLFARTLAQLPKRVPAGWSLNAVSNPESFVLSIKTGNRESDAVFFPLNPLQVKNGASQAAVPFDQGVRLSLQKSDQLLHPIASLKGVLVLRHGKAYAIDAPVVSAVTSGKSLE